MDMLRYWWTLVSQGLPAVLGGGAAAWRQAARNRRVQFWGKLWLVYSLSVRRRMHPS